MIFNSESYNDLHSMGHDIDEYKFVSENIVHSRIEPEEKILAIKETLLSAQEI